MARRLTTDDGHATRLECPECGTPCDALPPNPRNAENPYPWWENDERGKCAKCESNLIVCADGERAWLEVEGGDDE